MNGGIDATSNYIYIIQKKRSYWFWSSLRREYSLLIFDAIHCRPSYKYEQVAIVNTLFYFVINNNNILIEHRVVLYII